MILGEGLRLRSLGSRGTTEAFLTPDPATTPSDHPEAERSMLNWPVPVGFLALLSGVGVAAVALVGTYAYFPAPRETFQDMAIIKADFSGKLSARTLDPARHHLNLRERQADKLWIGSAIRFQAVDAPARELTDQPRRKIQTLRLALDAKNTEQIRADCLAINRLQDQCRRAYHAY